jgi:hypothetical protein
MRQCRCRGDDITNGNWQCLDFRVRVAVDRSNKEYPLERFSKDPFDLSTKSSVLLTSNWTLYDRSTDLCRSLDPSSIGTSLR